jgi:dephospho-CoA kinase
LAVDADPKIRYERIVKRNSETDRVNYDEFIANEQREMTSTDPNKQNLSKCIIMADYTLYNNGTVEKLCEEVTKLRVTD